MDEELLTRQSEIQRDFFGLDFEGMSAEFRPEVIKDMVLALTHELHEALDETGWKSWRTERHIGYPHYLDELVDAYIFLMNLVLVTGHTPSYLAQYMRNRTLLKMRVNVDRRTLDHRM